MTQSGAKPVQELLAQATGFRDPDRRERWGLGGAPTSCWPLEQPLGLGWPPAWAFVESWGGTTSVCEVGGGWGYVLIPGLVKLLARPGMLSVS